jgi:hypothetical protein
VEELPAELTAAIGHRNGLRLRDGREVVVKVRPSTPRLAGCAVVHRALWRAAGRRRLNARISRRE